MYESAAAGGYIPSEVRVLFWILAFIVVGVSILVCKRMCAGASGGHLFLAITMALIAALSWFALAWRGCEVGERDRWVMARLAFEGVCFAYPVAMMGSLAVVMGLRPHRKPRQSGMMITGLSAALLAGALLLLGLGIYSTQVEPNMVKLSRVELRSDKLRPGALPLRIVQISDTHIEAFGYRERCALDIIRRCKPDMILLTGDYANSWDDTRRVQQFMRGLHARYGVYAVNGNWNPGPKARAFFEGSDVKMIEGESVAVQTPSGRVSISGVSWMEGRSANPRVPTPPGGAAGKYAIVLCHVPDLSLHAPSWADLILSGHTHGGQVRLPFIGPLITLSNVPRERAAGLSNLPNGGHLYVNRGLGMEGSWAPRVRFLCPPEVTLITLRPKR